MTRAHAALLTLGVSAGAGLAFLAHLCFTPRVCSVYGDLTSNRVHRVAQELEIYRLYRGSYPSAEAGLAALVPDFASSEDLVDAFGLPLHYELPGRHEPRLDVYSLGADGRPGGDGENADVGSWQPLDIHCRCGPS